MTAPATTIARKTTRVSPWRPPLLRSLPLRLVVFAICLLWTIPTLGLLVTSVRNPAHYCSPACRQAVRNVKDRERKWLVRGTRDGRKKRSFEYKAARQRRITQQGRVTNPSPLRAPPD